MLYLSGIVGVININGIFTGKKTRAPGIFKQNNESGTQVWPIICRLSMFLIPPPWFVRPKSMVFEQITSQ